MLHVFKRFLPLFAIVALFPACDCGKGAEISKKTGLVVVNVLEPEQYNDCHIAGSINIPFGEGMLERFENEIDKDAQVVVYCSNYMCTASGTVQGNLRESGFSNVRAYEAGMAEWHQQKLPVEGECSMGYLKKVMERPEGHKDNPDVEITTSQLKEKMGA